MSPDLANLEFTADEMRRMGYATIGRPVDHVPSLETQPARGDVAAADLRRRLREPAPERGVAYEPLLDRLLAEWVPRSFASSGPGCLACVPGGGAVSGGAGGPGCRRGQSLPGIVMAAPPQVSFSRSTFAGPAPAWPRRTTLPSSWWRVTFGTA